MSDIRKKRGTTKSTTERQLLARTGGATLEEIIAETGWQPHSCRAFLSGVGKSGDVLVKLERTDGTAAWRITPQAEAEAEA